MNTHAPRPHTTPTKPHHRITLLHTDENNKTPKPTLSLLLFKTLQLTLTSLISLPHGYICESDNSKDIDKLLNSVEALRELRLRPRAPPHLLSARTLLIRHIDPEVGSLTSDQIKQHIAEHPQNISRQLKLSHVVKLPGKTKTIKVVTEDTTSAETICSKGFFIGHLKIPTDKIHPEQYTPLTTCYKCYKLGEHNTRDCTQEQPICSNCALPGHRHTHCPTPKSAQCVNCKRIGRDYNHHTLAMRCPYRKTQARATSRNNTTHTNTTHSTYAAAASSRTPLLLDPSPDSNTTLHPQSILKQAIRERVAEIVTKDLVTELTLIVLDAHIGGSLSQTETYHSILNENMKKHFDIDNFNISDLSDDHTLQFLSPTIQSVVDTLEQNSIPTRTGKPKNTTPLPPTQHPKLTVSSLQIPAQNTNDSSTTNTDPSFPPTQGTPTPSTHDSPPTQVTPAPSTQVTSTQSSQATTPTETTQVTTPSPQATTSPPDISMTDSTEHARPIVSPKHRDTSIQSRRNMVTPRKPRYPWDHRLTPKKQITNTPTINTDPPSTPTQDTPTLFDFAPILDTSASSAQDTSTQPTRRDE